MPDSIKQKSPPGSEEMEACILRDIEQRTGLRFDQLWQIAPDHEPVIVPVLPVLAEWILLVPQEGIRDAIAHCFCTKHATPFLRQMVNWAKREKDSDVCLSLLIGGLSLAVTEQDAEWLWSEVPNLPKPEYQARLLVKLAGFPSISAAVKDYIVEYFQSLDEDDLRAGDLQTISSIADPRIQAFIAAKVNDADPYIRQVARRIAERGKRLPRALAWATTPPDPTTALVSTEIDAADLPATLRGIERDLKIPATLRRGAFLARLPVDRWVLAALPSANLYFRLEDIDVVELAVMRDPGGNSPS